MTNTNTNTKTILALAVGLAASMVAGQAAVQINGTMGFIPMGDVTYTGLNLGAATSVVLPSIIVINQTPLDYLGNPNNFLSGSYPVLAGVTTVTMPGVLALPPSGSIPNFLVFQSTLGSGPQTYTFDLTSLNTSSGTDYDLSFQGAGMLYVTGGLYLPTPAQFSASFTTATTGGTINTSFTLNASPSVPEPSTYIAGLGALCLFAFTAIPKRKVS